MIHKSVLLHEAIDGLDIKRGETFVDCTLGNGGHTEEVCKRFGNTVAMIGIDLDPEAIQRAKNRLPGCSVKYCLGNFRDFDSILDSLGIKTADKVLLDIGLSSNQLEESGRGFSFQKNEPLNMNFKKNLSENDLTAEMIINNWEEKNIEILLRSYGEERFAGRIAREIVKKRKLKPIETTDELVEIIKSATPLSYHHRKIHPATKTFQTLRVAVNDEIGNLKNGLEKSFERLSFGGRLAVISFHSLEDRTVKFFFRDKEDAGEGLRITKKPIAPSEEEIKNNPRSRSAKLRIITKLPR